MKKILLALAFITFSSPALAVADHEVLNKGYDSYSKGDYKTAFILLKKAVDWPEKYIKNLKDLPRALHFVGYMYQYGQGVPRDLHNAVKHQSISAFEGFADAQFIFGAMYYNGHGVPQNYKTAKMWMERSAEQGFAEAQNFLGSMYDHGYGVPKDYKTAVKWYKLAADQGNRWAQSNLGALYRAGNGGPYIDYISAFKYDKMAAMQGDGHAANRVGKAYEKGEGTLQDLTRAWMWFSVASIKNKGGLSRHRDRIEKKMTSAEIAHARKFTRMCYRNNKISC